jgi:hypothetical protein
LNDLRISGLRSDFPFQAATANQNYAPKDWFPGVGGDVAPILNISGVPALNGTVGFRASTTFELLDDLNKNLVSCLTISYLHLSLAWPSLSRQIPVYCFPAVTWIPD